VLFVLGPLRATAVAQSPLAADACPLAPGLGSLPFREQIDTATATHEPDEPPLSCATRGALWYRLFPATDGRICVRAGAAVGIFNCSVPSECSECLLATCRDLSDGSTLTVDVLASVPVLIGVAAVGPPGFKGGPTIVEILDAAADTDDDGVPDCADRCPQADDTVDSDADDIPDCLDACPN